MVKSTLKKENQFVFLIINSSLAGGILGVALINFASSNSTVTHKLFGFLLYFVVVASILAISTRYYQKMK